MPTVIVGGIAPLAEALERSGQFPEVLVASSTSELLALITGPLMRQKGAHELVFIFGDTITQDDPNMTLSEILRRLTSADYQVIVATITPKGAELQRANPKAGLLALPLRLNDVLFAIGAFGYSVDPVEGGTAPISLDEFVPTGKAAPLQMPVADPAPRATEPVAAPSGWQMAPVEAEAPAPAPAMPAPTAPVTSGWASPEPSPEPMPAAAAAPLTFPAPTPAAAPLTFAAPTEPSPAASFPPPAAAPLTFPAPAAEPFAAPAPTPAPMPFAAPAPAAPATPDFAPPAPAASFPPPAAPATGFAAPDTFAPPAAPAPFMAPTPAAPAPYPAAPQQGGFAAPQNPWGVATPAEAPMMRPDAYPSAPATPQRRGFVCTIAVSKGGVGKSSMTLNLAAFLGMRLRSQGKTVAVIDANYQQADSGKYLDTYTPNINTIVNNPGLLTPERILDAMVHKPEYNLSVLLGPATPDEGNPLAISARLYNEILDLLLVHYDYVFIDTPVAEKFHEMFSDFALSRANYVVVPVAPNFTTLHNADNWLRAAVVAPRSAGGANLDPNRIGIVLNRAEDGIGCSEDDVRQTMASWHYLGAIPETKEWKAANNRNELVAPKNYAELSQAFAEVLHAATGEPILVENLGMIGDSGGGLGSKLKGLFRRNG